MPGDPTPLADRLCAGVGAVGPGGSCVRPARVSVGRHIRDSGGSPGWPNPAPTQEVARPFQEGRLEPRNMTDQSPDPSLFRALGGWMLPPILAIALSSCSRPSDMEPLVSPIRTDPTTPTPSLAVSIAEGDRVPSSTPPASPTVLPTSTAQGIAAGSSSQSAHFLDETIPDCSQMEAGQEFTKTWRFANSGATSWAQGYGLALLSGSPASEDLGSAGFVPLPSSVAPGEEVQISVDLLAPAAEGAYTLYYGLRAADGSAVLIDGGNLWVTIAVEGAPCGGSASGGSATYAPELVSVSRDASTTTIRYCMQLPDDTPSWFPSDMFLIYGANRVPAAGAGVVNYRPGSDRCFDTSFSVGKDVLSQAGGFQFSIGAIKIDPVANQEENCARAQAEIRTSHPGLEFACGGRGFFYSLADKPAGMSDQEADRIIMDALERTVYGPWVLSLP